MTDGNIATRPARVCVSGRKECSGHTGRTSKPQDGGPMAPRGRGLRPRRYGLSTTTHYTLGLVSSSIGRAGNLSIHNSPGGRRA